MYQSAKWMIRYGRIDQNSNVNVNISNNTNINDKYDNNNTKEIIYVVKMQRLKGNGIDYNSIQKKILTEQSVEIFNGLPKWAQEENVKQLMTVDHDTSVSSVNISKTISASTIVISTDSNSNYNYNNDAKGDTDHDDMDEQKSISMKDNKHNKDIKDINPMSFVSGLSLVSKTFASFKSDIKYTIKNPLIVLLGIGDYDEGVMPSLTGVPQDYMNMIFTFHHTFGYAVTFEIKEDSSNDKKDENSKNSKNSKYKYYTSTNKVESLRNCYTQVKTHWIDEEIEDYFDNCKQLILSNKHDSCIFILSSHGEAQDVILDSQGNEISLGYLFGTFNGMCCQYLVDKPKIIFVDACRGSMKSKPVTPVFVKKASLSALDSNITAVDTGAIEKAIYGLATRGRNYDYNVATVDTMNVLKEKDKKEKQVLRKESIIYNNKAYHIQANFRYIYGNPQGYAVFDGGLQGGYLIRSIKKVMLNTKMSLNKNLDDIISRIRSKTQEMAGKVSMECVEDVNTLGYKVFFAKHATT